ncbi:MAG: DUF1499 domain-containing protein [Acidobacteriota bacterium]
MANFAIREEIFPDSPETVRVRVERALSRLGWAPRRPAGDALHAVWTSPVFRFRDDVVVAFSAEGSGTRVRVRSSSRVGRYDFGQNARHIRALFREVARQPSG